MKSFEQAISLSVSSIFKVVDFEPMADKILVLDFTALSAELTDDLLNSTDLFSSWVNNKLSKNKARYGIGGYNERRTIYARSPHFNTAEEPRRLHLGVDIWGAAGTPIYNFFNAKVHSFANNSTFGDYGATIILAYDIGGLQFNALYGHLSLASLNGLSAGMFIPGGAEFARLGPKEENGCWPPHLHFQIIKDMQGFTGDYPGVCKYSDRQKYLDNCPDPSLILKKTFFLV